MSKPVQLLQQQTSQLQAQIQTAASSAATPTNMMTTDTEQAITGNKVFNGSVAIRATIEHPSGISYEPDSFVLNVNQKNGDDPIMIQLPYAEEMYASYDYLVSTKCEQILQNKTLYEPVISTLKQSNTGGIINLPTVAAGSTATLAKAARVRTSLTIREFDRTHYKTNIPIADCDLTHYKLFYDILNSIF